MEILTEEEVKKIEEYLEKFHEEYESCDCGGSPSKPENYCDDCQYYREKMELLSQ